MELGAAGSHVAPTRRPRSPVINVSSAATTKEMAASAPASNSTPMEHQLTITIPMPSPHHASVAAQVLSVDKELKPHFLRHTLHAEGATLTIHYEASSVKLLRTSVNGVFEQLVSVVRTMIAFPALE
ncbi:hypothetical protein AMAG_00605 [Allomyces macrogynus ATCC 38327]|uniref:Transcription factor Pcc1 n=1 Tax=Allomyces macrogynus (strain ATCC 38327) TaxID=578462 RepID=A0A0L0RWY8_ALLM3|nr:hypothetical protein AMAG_00605 [Allomyces macrogynus ATCC 38327]|eukprot:KNE54645.1 hypothetical protein AMAG_00605 [Allomyces macrogynus ATCC 38327]